MKTHMLIIINLLATLMFVASCKQDAEGAFFFKIEDGLQEWHVDLDKLDYTFLIFQEEFINNFLSDKYFMYRLLYCYQHDYPTFFDMSTEEMVPFLS